MEAVLPLTIKKQSDISREGYLKKVKEKSYISGISKKTWSEDVLVASHFISGWKKKNGRKINVFLSPSVVRKLLKTDKFFLHIYRVIKLFEKEEKIATDKKVVEKYSKKIPN